MQTKRKLLLLLLLALLPVTAFGQVVISEIMYDASGADADREWVEIFNSGKESVDLSRAKFLEGGVHHALVISSGNNFLPPGGLAVIVQKPESFLADNAGFAGTIFDSSFSLTNSVGEPLAIVHGSTTSSTALYNPKTGARGDGNSLQSINGEWVASLPTPGAPNVFKVSAPPTVLPANAENTSAQKQKAISPPPASPSSDKNTLINTSSVSEKISQDYKTETSGSSLKWYLLLGGIILVGALAYWSLGRTTEEEYTIIEDKSEDSL